MFGMQVIRDRWLRLAPKHSYARYKYCGKKGGRRRGKQTGCKYTHGGEYTRGKQTGYKYTRGGEYTNGKQTGYKYTHGGEYTHGKQIGCKNIGSKHIRWSPRRFRSSGCRAGAPIRRCQGFGRL